MRTATPVEVPLFQLEHVFENYRDYVARANYARAGVRVTLTYNTDEQRWSVVVVQETAPCSGEWELVLARDLTEDDVARLAPAALAAERR